MKTSLIAAAVLAAALFPGVAHADKPCPPGLAKKSLACVPPGLARQGVTAREWRQGDRLDEDYVIIRDRWRYDLPDLRDGEAYVPVGDAILRVERETLQVIALVGLFGDLVN
ncbi:MAG: excinuclease ABC subunit A [Paracoccaceae bacterium]|nr:excinuclease ABC subunit A [Paracoccaceae bacterium]